MSPVRLLVKASQALSGDQATSPADLSRRSIATPGAALAKLLRSPVAIQALTRGMTMPVTAPAAVKAATVANLVRAAQAAGVPLAKAT